jgi:translation initiation factor IF-1
MSKSDLLIALWEVVECSSNATFKVKIVWGYIPAWTEVLCHISGKMRMYYIKILLWDLVKVEISPYSLDKWRINARYKWKNDPKLLDDEELKEFLN